MKIEFGVQEYFNELKLMDAQYGQEEELYPWIYMLLQMAECRKKEIFKEWYQGVSIRDVHNGQSAENNSELKKSFKGNVRFPDFVILDRKVDVDSKNGCVEIKKNTQSLKLIEEKYLKNDEGQFNIKLSCSTYIVDIRCILEEIKKTNLDDNDIQKIENACNYAEKGDLAITIEIKNALEIAIKKELKEQNIITLSTSYSANQYERILEMFYYKNADGLVEKNKELNITLYGKTITINRDAEEKKDVICALPEDVAGYFENYTKVLYTNGLEFYYLVLNEEKNYIDVKKIADLQPMYSDFKETSTPSTQLLLEASAEWDRLIAGLTSIDWHKDPVAKIPSAQPSTEETSYVRD